MDQKCEQDRLITSEARRIRCIAGPGTGKTRCIQYRVRNILENKRVDGSRIFAVTFTRQAAAKLKRDLCGLKDSCNQDLKGAKLIMSSTLHSYAFKILSHEQAIQSLGRKPRPCFESELAPFFHDLAEEFGSVENVKKKLRDFVDMWADLDNENLGWPQKEEDKRFHSRYLEWMEFHGGITVGELIPLAYQYLWKDSLSDVHNAFDHIIVDEYQDLNKADQALIELIGENSNITIAGDDDQAIYKFRGAHPAGIREWYDKQPEPKDDIELNICWRCDGKILSLANSLINRNTNRSKSDLQPLQEKENSGDVHIIQWKTRQRETNGIAEAIKKMLDLGEIPEDKNILVLVSRNEFGQRLLEILSKHDVKDVEFNVRPKWSNRELGQRLALLTLVEKLDDLIALRYWLGLENPEWRRREYSRLYEYCRTNGFMPNDVLNNDELCTSLRIQGLKDRWDDLASKLSDLETLSKDELLDELLPIDASDDDVKKIAEMVRSIQKSDTDDKSIRRLLIEALIAPLDRESKARVRIMTYWGAKGMSGHTVIITGLVNGILPTVPNPNIAGLADLEEQRRLMFVTITRAEKRLIISSFLNVNKSENKQLKLGLTGNQEWLRTHASRFLSEMGPSTPRTENGEDWLRSL